jgi:hypothetical protein
MRSLCVGGRECRENTGRSNVPSFAVSLDLRLTQSFFRPLVCRAPLARVWWGCIVLMTKFAVSFGSRLATHCFTARSVTGVRHQLTWQTAFWRDQFLCLRQRDELFLWQLLSTKSYFSRVGGESQCATIFDSFFLDVLKLDSTDRHAIVRASTLSGSVEQRFPIEKRMKPWRLTDDEMREREFLVTTTVTFSH